MTDEDKALVGRLRKDTNETDTWNRKKNWTEQRSERREAAARIEAQAAEIERLRVELRQIEVDAAGTYNDWCEAGCDAKDAIRFAFDIGTYCRAALGEMK